MLRFSKNTIADCSEQFGLSWQPQRICRIFNMYDLSSSAIRRIVNSLIPIIDANFRNDCHPKSALEPFQRLQRSLRCILSSDSSSLAYWNLRWTVLKPYILSQRHKRLILGIQIELFPLLSVQSKGLRWLRLIEYTLHLVSTSRPFWKYDCLLETSFSNQQSLAEIHSIAEILN